MTLKKALIIIAIILGLAAYTAASFWVIKRIRTGVFINTAIRPAPANTPTPLQGPGRYACDQDGVCGDFSEERRTSCPKTFADQNCLGMCGTPSVRCAPAQPPK